MPHARGALYVAKGKRALTNRPKAGALLKCVGNKAYLFLPVFLQK